MLTLKECKQIAEMRRTDYFCDDEVADVIEWLVKELDHYKNLVKKLDGTVIGAVYENRK